MRSAEPIEIYGDGTQTRCLCHVTDAIQALKGLMDDAPTSGEIFNVGSTNRISITELAGRVKEMTRSESDIVYLPYEEVYGQGIEDMLHRIPAIDKIHDRIGWEPTLDLDLILADVIKHRRTTPVELVELAGV